MQQDLVRRVRKTSLLTGVVLAWVLAVYSGLGAGIAWLLGCLWSVVNLYVIAVLVRTTMKRGKLDKGRVLLIVAVKVPVLYGAGFALLSTDLPVAALLFGSLWPLLVITLKVLGRAVLGMDRGAGGTAGLGAGKA